MPNHQDKTKFHMWKKVIVERLLVFGGIEKKTLNGKVNIKILICSGCILNTVRGYTI